MANLLLSTSLLANNATNAQFRAWGQNVSSALSSSGWVQTSDTGQINWATVAAPGASSTAMGYEIWRMSDALQSSAPVYLKIDYGSGSAANNPGLGIQISSSVDGAGNLMANPTTRVLVSAGTAIGNSTPAFFCGANSRFAMAFNISSSSSTLWWGIERTHDSNGNDTAEGVLLAMRWSLGNWSQVYYNIITGPATAEASAGVFPPATGSQGTNGNQTQVYPIFAHRGVLVNPFMNFVGGFANVFSDFATVTFPYYGSTRTYLPISSNGTFTAARSTALAPLMRWD